MVERSESLLLSLACFSSSAGLRVIMTTTLRIETMAKTTRSSMRVKEEREETIDESFLFKGCLLLHVVVGECWQKLVI